MSGEREPVAPVCWHCVSHADIDDLAKGVESEATLTALLRAERSYRRLVLRAALDAARQENISPLAPADVAWDLLVRADRRNPRGTAEMLELPQVGTWASRVLRRIHGQLHDDMPLWVDLGYLHALAVAAAIRAKLLFKIAVPVMRGYLSLPSLGFTYFPELVDWATAEIRPEDQGIVAVTSSGTVALSFCWDGSTPGWHSPVRLQMASRNSTISVTLEDSDPYRYYLGVEPPVFLSASVSRRWQFLFEGAVGLLLEDHPAEARAINAIWSSLVPLSSGEQFREQSSSSGDAFGSISASLPSDHFQFAVSLVHEIQHAKLGALLHLVDLMEGGESHVFYAPWRDDPRPLQGLIQGIYAFFGMTRFWRDRAEVNGVGDAALAHFEFALWRMQVGRAVAEAGVQPELTRLGQRFLAGIAKTVSSWMSDPVPDSQADLARLAAVDHRASWRIYHLRPPTDAVREIADAWTARRCAPRPLPRKPSELRADPAPPYLDVRATMIRHLLAGPERFFSLDQDGRANELVSGASAADTALVAGRHHDALRLYIDELAADNDRGLAWSGLGLVLGRIGNHGAARVLLGRPELVRAVSREVGHREGHRPRPVALATWLGGFLDVP